MCNIPRPSKPCQLCERTGRKCTFLAEPAKKCGKKSALSHNVASLPHSTSDDDAPQQQGFQPSAATAGTPHGRALEWTFLATGVSTEAEDLRSSRQTAGRPQSSSSGHSDTGQHVQFRPVRNGDNGSFFESSEYGWDLNLDQGSLLDIDMLFDRIDNVPIHQNSELIAGTLSLGQEMNAAEDLSIHDSVVSQEFSLDQKHDFTSQWFGFTNEADPFLLNFLPTDSMDELKFFKLIYRKIANGASMSNEAEQSTAGGIRPVATLPTYFLCSHRETLPKSAEMIDGYLSGGVGQESDTEALHKLVDMEFGAVLIRLCVYLFPNLLYFRPPPPFLRKKDDATLNS